MDINKKIDQINHKLNLKKFDEVIIDCEKLIKVHSSTSIFHNFLGLALQAKGKHKESFKCFTKAIELDQKDYAPKINLANSFMYLNDFENAEKIFNKLMIEKPNDFLLIANFANFKKKIKDFKSAVELYEDAFKKSNYQPLIMNDLAKIYLNIGQFEKSKKIYEEIIKKFPLSVDAHISLSRLINYSADQKHMKTMIDIYKNSNLEDHEKGILAFGISKAFEDLSDFKMSYTYFKDANQLIDRNLKYNLSNEQKLFSSIKKNFERFKTSEIKDQHKNKRIIFVCGLPRSGTTLVEQILSSHKEAIGIGEVEYLETAIQKFFIQDNKVLSQNLSHIKENTNPLNYYSQQIANFKYKENLIVDKTPHNFRWIGFIKNFFPNSKIILCKRNLKDNFLSILKNYFASYKHMGWSYNPKNIITYFKMYSDLTSYWLKKYPESIYVLDYDKLVNDKESEIKLLLKECDLPWDENCLSHHKNNKSTINTVSIIQARKPIYASSSNLSDNYQAHLGDYFKELSAID